MSVDPAVLEPPSAPSLSRRAEVDRRHRVVAGWLTARGFGAALFFDPDWFCWLSAGGQLSWFPHGRRDGPVLLLTPTQRCVIASGDETSRLFDEELSDLGFQLKELPIGQPPRQFAGEIAGTQPMVCDQFFLGGVEAAGELARLRRAITRFDLPRLRGLALVLAHAVEATLRTFERGQSEREIAAHLAHRLLHHDMEPVAIEIFADDRSSLYPRNRPSEQPVHERCTILATATATGLSVTTSRTMSFGTPSPELRRDYQMSSLICGTLLYFSQLGESADSVLRKGLRIYEKLGEEFEWRGTPQGWLGGSAQPGTILSLGNDLELEEGMTLCWRPTVRGVVSADGVLVDRAGGELLTFFDRWPTVGVQVKDVTILRPDILVR